MVARYSSSEQYGVRGPGAGDAWLRNDQPSGNDDLMDYMCPPTPR